MLSQDRRVRASCLEKGQRISSGNAQYAPLHDGWWDASKKKPEVRTS